MTPPAEFDLDTGMFSVHQLHPEVAIRYACNTAWLALRGRNLQTLITEHRTSLVVVSNEVTYQGPLTFFSAPSITSEAAVHLRDDGRLLVFDVQHRANGRDVVSVRVRTRPVALSGGPALDATPTAVDDRIRALFTEDEIVRASSAPARALRRLVARIAAESEELGGGEVPVFIGRNDCELADQWLHARLPSLVATAREWLLLNGGADLAACVKNPISKFHGEFLRPMYFGDEGRIRTTAYRDGETVHAVHEVRGALPPDVPEDQRPLCALALETFE